MKICRHCKIEKEDIEFGLNKRLRDGKRSYCKKCESERCKEYWKKNPEKYKKNYLNQNAKKDTEDYRKYNAKRYEKDPDFYKKWYWSNPEKRAKKIAYRKVWNEKNPEKYAQYAKTQRERNSLKTKVRSQVKEARKRGILIKPQECCKCGKGGKIEGHHEDYSKPLKVTWLCVSCHRKIHMEK